MLQGVEKERKSFAGKIKKIGREINEKADKLKRMTDFHRDKLIAELSALQQKRMEEIELVRDKIETQLWSMESCKSKVKELIEKGAACDIVTADDLHESANKLLVLDVIERSLTDLSHVGITFTSSNYVINDVSRTLGGESVSRV